MATAAVSDWSRFYECPRCRAEQGEPCADPRVPNGQLCIRAHSGRPRMPLPKHNKLPRPELRTGDVWTARNRAFRRVSIVEVDEHRVTLQNLTTGHRSKVRIGNLARLYRPERP